MLQGNMPLDFSSCTGTVLVSTAKGQQAESSNSKQEYLFNSRDWEYRWVLEDAGSEQQKRQSPPRSSWKATWVNECTWPDVQRGSYYSRGELWAYSPLDCMKAAQLQSSRGTEDWARPFCLLGHKSYQHPCSPKTNMLSIKLYNLVSHDPTLWSHSPMYGYWEILPVFFVFFHWPGPDSQLCVTPWHGEGESGFLSTAAWKRSQATPINKFKLHVRAVTNF